MKTTLTPFQHRSLLRDAPLTLIAGPAVMVRGASPCELFNQPE